MTNHSDTIAAIATGVGGAISIIRVSGDRAIESCDAVFRSVKGTRLADRKGYSLLFGSIVDEVSGEIVDEVIVSIFRTPNSYTGENMVEISCHASPYIQQTIMKLLSRHGVRSAEAGEFTIRAFLAGKLDLAQAEAVADMIAASDKASHAMAILQIRGGYSSEFSALRERLLHLVSMLELELDFSEEDVEFADRGELFDIISEIESKVGSLLKSFSLGNGLKNGVPVAIVGEPNVGKSTLLNALLKEDRAMVSDIAGTTRDVIEESINIDGIRFRFIDTAGIRETDDTLERMGIERTLSTIDKATIIIAMHDAESINIDLMQGFELRADQQLCVVVNKIDKISEGELHENLKLLGDVSAITISAKSGLGVANIEQFLHDSISLTPLYSGDTVVSNSRHYDLLYNASESLIRARLSLDSGITGDLLSQDIKDSLYYLSAITGEITTDDILASIFSKFCIGK